MCAQQRLWSAWASAQSDQSLLCAQWVAKDPSFLLADSEDSDAQADLSVRWAHMPFCWFYHEVGGFFWVFNVFSLGYIIEYWSALMKFVT